jgi:hypothetical protein
LLIHDTPAFEPIASSPSKSFARVGTLAESACDLAVAPAPQPLVLMIDVARDRVERARERPRTNRLHRDRERAAQKKRGEDRPRAGTRPVQREAEEDAEVEEILAGSSVELVVITSKVGR